MPDKPPARTKRPPSYLGLMALSLLLGLAIGLAAALIGDFGGPATRLLQLGVLVVGAVAIMAICIRWWRSADEAVREAHKWAGYWGGSAGMAALMLLFTASSADLITLSIPPYGDGPDGALWSGVLLALGAQLIGYLVAWAAWWLRHR